MILRLAVSLSFSISIYFILKQFQKIIHNKKINRRMQKYLFDKINSIWWFDNPILSYFYKISFYLRGHRIIINIFSIIKKVFPKNEVKNKLNILGLSREIDLDDLIFVQITICLFFVFISLPFLLNDFIYGFMLLFVLVALGFYYPIFILKSRAEEKQIQIKNELPVFIDLLFIGIDAGMSFDRVISLYCQRFDNFLSLELKRMLEEINLGMSRRKALRALAVRSKVDDLTQLVSAIAQSEKLGTPLTKILRVQSKEIKTRRRQWIQELSAKAPIKMIFPLVGLIMPALFAVLLGPLIIRMASSGGF